MSNQPIAKPVPTFEEAELTKLTVEVQRNHALAWEVVQMFQALPALQIKHPMLYLRARQRVLRNQAWFRAGRTLGRVSRALAGFIGRYVAHWHAQPATNVAARPMVNR